MCSQRFLCSRKHHCVLRRIVASKEKLSRVLPLWATVESHPPPLTQYKKKEKNSCRRLDPEKNPVEAVDVKKIFPQAEKVLVPITFLMVRPLYVQLRKMSIVFGTGRFTNCTA